MQVHICNDVTKRRKMLAIRKKKKVKTEQRTKEEMENSQIHFEVSRF